LWDDLIKGRKRGSGKLLACERHPLGKWLFKKEEKGRKKKRGRLEGVKKIIRRLGSGIPINTTYLNGEGG